MNKEEAYNKLAQFGQTHLLAFWPLLSEPERRELLSDIGKTDFACLRHFPGKSEASAPADISPIPVLSLDEIRRREDALRSEGMKLLGDGRVAAVLMAGGMGSRLGSDCPKGAFDIGITRPVYIFQRLIENLLEAASECPKKPLLLIMTSDLNDEATRLFLKEHGYFGYEEERIRFFRQSAAPAVDSRGFVLLSSPSRIASAPNGNGGWFRSILDAGLLKELKDEGVAWLNVFGVDNVLQRICDPVFIGAVSEGGYQSGTKVVTKTDPDEKVGVICERDGHPGVVEYIELPEEMRRQKDESGSYTYRFGVIGNYLFRLDILEAACGDDLPLHFAHKKVTCLPMDAVLQAAGSEPVSLPAPAAPEEPNAWKFEYFIFDILKSFDSCLPFEVVRGREFAPVKNRTGTDSVESARVLCRENGILL